MNPILQWILHHERGQWASARTRARYEQLFGPLSGSPAPTPAQAAEGNRLWRSALGQAFYQDRVRQAIVTTLPNAPVAMNLYLLMKDRRGPLTIPVRVVGVGPFAASASRDIDVQIPAGATGQVMWDLIDAAIAADKYLGNVTVTGVFILHGTRPT